MKRILVLVFASCTVKLAAGQPTEKIINKKPAGKQQVVSAGINVPLGDFSSTHIGGIAIEYARSRNRFGQLSTLPSKKLGYVIEGGLAYYLGKKETISGYAYKYPGYYFLHAYPGLLYTPCKKGNISLNAGPALGLYNGDLRFTIGAKLQGSWYVNEKTGINPGIFLMKESGTDPLWGVTLKATLTF
jgi:hypothetical protein